LAGQEFTDSEKENLHDYLETHLSEL
jgi:hypothetical protein